MVPAPPQLSPSKRKAAPELHALVHHPSQSSSLLHQVTRVRMVLSCSLFQARCYRHGLLRVSEVSFMTHWTQVSGNGNRTCIAHVTKFFFRQGSRTQRTQYMSHRQGGRGNISHSIYLSPINVPLHGIGHSSNQHSYSLPFTGTLPTLP